MSRLTTYFGSDTSGMERGLNRAQGHVARFSSNVRRNLFRAFAVGALIAQLRGISQELDRIDKLSKRFGVGTGFLQDLDQQAKLSGASLEEATKSISRLIKELNRANGPTAEIAAEIEALGLNMNDLKGLNAEQLFAIIADSIGNLASETDQLAAAQNILGRSAGELLPMLQDVYENGGLADAPKHTQDAIDTTVRFNDSMTKLGTTLKTFISPVLVLVASLVNIFMTGFNTMGKQIGSVIWSLIESFQNLGSAIKAALTLDGDGIKSALELQRETLRNLFTDLKGDSADARKQITDDFKRIANAFGGNFEIDGPSAPTDGGPRERTGSRNVPDSGTDNEKTVTALQREEMGLVQSIKRLQDAMTDPRNMGVSSIQRVGGGGTANLPNQDASLRVQNKQLAELARIREAILAAQGGMIR